MVSSSRPSSPRKTHASTPRRAKTPAITGAIRGSAQPIAWAPGRAGFVSGPRRLNEVATPSSRRGTAAKRMAGWNAAEKQNVMPASVATAATRDAGRSRRMPRASRTSADPDFEDAERLPCLTTCAPAPAATIAAIVEMLTDIERSPPVPTTSSRRPGTEILVARPSIAAARPASSSTVSPLARSATANPAIWAGDASPDRISSMAQAACASLRSVPSTSAVRTCGQVAAISGWRGRGSGAARRPTRPAGSGRAGAAPRPRPATRWPARRPGGARSAPGSAGTRRSRP